MAVPFARAGEGRLKKVLLEDEDLLKFYVETLDKMYAAFRASSTR